MAQRIIIDGQEFTLPNLDELNMEQAMILERYTGMSLAELAEADLSRASLVAAFCHLAIREQNPRASFVQIETQVKKIAFARLNFATDEEEAEDGPPEEAQSSSGSEPESSGPSSESSTDATPEPTLPRIGMQA
jgi:hypothetical protein